MKIFRKINLQDLQSRNRSRFMIPSFIADVFDSGKVFLAGGAIRSVFDGTPIADYDVYCTSVKDYNFVCDYFKGLTGKSIIKERVSNFQVGKYKIQVMFWGYGSVENVLDNFDMDCVRFAIDNRCLYIGTKQSIRDAKKKYIFKCTVEKKNPFLVLRRLFKYQRKGYVIDSEVWYDLFKEIRLWSEAEINRHYDRIVDAGNKWEEVNLTEEYEQHE